MSQFFELHQDNPQIHLLRQIASIILQGGVVVYPTDSCYAIGCHLGNKTALMRIKQIRQLSDEHNFTLMCRDLSDLSTYARVENNVYRLLKAFTPGPYTFILNATKEVPRRLQHPKRKTIGLRVPDHVITQAILEAVEQPLMSTSLILPGQILPFMEPEAIKDALGKRVDLIITGGPPGGMEQTTVVDLTSGKPEIIRLGKGSIEGLALKDEK
jgi:tRNA threonylcarbamoyl adenosine modification protein (Sua5/YciO/YrdC/YwlC family)